MGANAPPAAEPVVSPPKVSAPFAATEPPEPIEISQEAFVATEETVADGVIIKSPAGKAEPVAAQAVAAAAVVEPEAPKAGEKPVAVAAAVEAAPKKAPDAVAAAVVGAGGESKDGQPVTAEEAAGLLPTEEGAAPAVMVKRKPRFFHDLALMVAQLMDMPFAALGQDAKQCIGVAGVIFLGTGVVLMVLSHMHR